jgi:hypothetical protein
MTGVARFICACVVLVEAVGCAPKPSLRSAVYDGFGPSFAVMKPAVGLPASALAQNDYRYVPGALTIPRIDKPRDDINHRSEVWRINQAAEDCSPSSQLYRLADLQSFPRLPVYIEYILDSENLFVPEINNNRTAAKIDLNLHDNDLRYVKRIRIEITNVMSYSASEARLNDALRDITSPQRCRFAFMRRSGVVQINNILSGDIKVELDVLQGASLRLVDVLKAKVYKSITKHIQGKAVFFAVSGRSVLRIN